MTTTRVPLSVASAIMRLEMFMHDAASSIGAHATSDDLEAASVVIAAASAAPSGAEHSGEERASG